MCGCVLPCEIGRCYVEGKYNSGNSNNDYTDNKEGYFKSFYLMIHFY